MGRQHSSGETKNPDLLALFNQQGGFCHYCRKKMCTMNHRHNSVTKDHVVPLHDGGADVPENWVAACYTCNQEKGTLSADAYQQQRAAEHAARQAEMAAVRARYSRS